MSRSPKSSSPRWVPLFFSSGLSNKWTYTTPRPPAITTPNEEDSVKKESPTPVKKEETATPAKKQEAGPWILLHDRNGRQFMWNKTTGHWTYDGIAIYAPPTPALGVMGYNQYRLHQQRQHQQHQQQQLFSYAQPTVGYHAPRPYAAVQHHPWQQPPPPMAMAQYQGWFLQHPALPRYSSKDVFRKGVF